MKINFNTDLKISSPERLIETWNLLENSPEQDKEIILDFSNLQYIRPFAATLIYGMLQKPRKWEKSFKIIIPKKRSALHQMAFLLGDLFPDHFPKYKGPGIKVSEVHKDFSEELEKMLDLIRDNIKSEYPGSVRKLVHLSLKECLDNIFNHAGDTDIRLITGNVLPTKRRIRLALLDNGVGIQNGLKNDPKYSYISSDEEALKLAIQDGISGEPDSKRGKGLFILSEFVKSNGGILNILSGNCMMEVTREGEVIKNLKNRYQGTIINIELIINHDFYFNFDDLMDDAEAIF